MKDLLEQYEKKELEFYVPENYMDTGCMKVYTNNNVISDDILKFIKIRYKKYVLEIDYFVSSSGYVFLLHSVINDEIKKSIVNDLIRLLKKEGWKQQFLSPMTTISCNY